jgi:hypothetical protein
MNQDKWIITFRSDDVPPEYTEEHEAVMKKYFGKQEKTAQEGITDKGDSPQGIVQEGVLAIVGLCLLALPLVLVGISFVMVGFFEASNRKALRKCLSEYLGIKVKDEKIYTDMAEKHFNTVIGDNRKPFTDYLYKPEETKSTSFTVNHVIFAIGTPTEHTSASWTNDITMNKLILVGECLFNTDYDKCAVIKKSDIKPYQAHLNKSFPGLQFTIRESNHFPGDDGGGDWQLFVDAGLVSVNPEDLLDRSREEEWDDDRYQVEWWKLLEELEEALKTYSTIEVCIVVAAKKFLDEHVKDVEVQESFVEQFTTMYLVNPETGEEYHQPKVFFDAPYHQSIPDQIQILMLEDASSRGIDVSEYDGKQVDVMKYYNEHGMDQEMFDRIETLKWQYIKYVQSQNPNEE